MVNCKTTAEVQLTALALNLVSAENQLTPKAYAFLRNQLLGAGILLHSNDPRFVFEIDSLTVCFETTEAMMKTYESFEKAKSSKVLFQSLEF